MKNSISIIFDAFDKIIECRGNSLVCEGMLQETLNYFFKNGNCGVNALRELIEEYNEDTVDVVYETINENESNWKMYVCFRYHDFIINEHITFSDDYKRISSIEIIDTSRNEIENIKQGFKTKK